MSSTMLGIWLVIAVSIMLGMDILEAIVKYRNNKIEEVHTVPHDIITLNVKGVIPREVIVVHDDKFVSEEICEKLATEIMAKNLVNLRTFSSFESGMMHYEATLRVVDPKGGYEDV